MTSLNSSPFDSSPTPSVASSQPTWQEWQPAGRGAASYAGKGAIQWQRQDQPAVDTRSGQDESSVNASYVRMDDDDADEQVLSMQLQGRDDKTRRCRCCFGGCIMSRRRYILLCTAICACFLLFLLLLALYIIAPPLIRSQISRSTLSFGSVEIVGVPTAQAVRLRSTAAIEHVMKMKVEVGSMDLTVYEIESNDNGDNAVVFQSSSPAPSSPTFSRSLLSGSSGDSSLTLLGHLPLSALTLNGATHFTTDSTFIVSSVSAFNAFAQKMVLQREVCWRLQSSASMKPYLFGVIPLPTYSGIPFSKDVTLSGCDGLKDVTLKTFSFRNSTRSQLLLEASVEMVNPSLFVLDSVGRLEMNIFYKGKKQGRMWTLSNDTRLNTGNNTIAFGGILEPEDLTVTNEVVVRYLTGQTTMLDAQPDPTHGSSIPFYNQALQKLKLSTPLNGLPRGSLIRSLNARQLHLDPSTTDSTLDIQIEIDIEIDSPLGDKALLELHTIQMDAQAIFVPDSSSSSSNEEAVSEPLPIGTMRMDVPAPVYAVDPLHRPALYRGNMSATLHLQQPYTNYQTFVRAFVAADGVVALNFSGKANVSTTYLYGKILVEGVPVENTLWITGAGGLKHTSEKELFIVGNRPDCPEEKQPYCGVDLRLSASMINPAPMYLNLHSAWFDLIWQNIRLGSVFMANLTIQPGLNDDLEAVGYLDPQQGDLKPMATFISQYVSGVNHTVQLRGLTGDPEPFGTSLPSSSFSSSMSAQALTVSCLEVSSECHGLHVELMSQFDVRKFTFDFSQTLPGASKNTNVENGGDDFPVVLASSIVHTRVTLPPSLNLPINITSSDAHFAVGQGPPGPGGSVIPLGQLNVSRFPAHYLPGSTDELVLDFDGAAFVVKDSEAFSNFASVMMSQPVVNITMSGDVGPTAMTNMGELPMEGVAVSQSISLIGFNSFYTPDNSSSLLHVHGLDILGADPAGFDVHGQYEGGGSIELRCNVSLDNPSTLGIRGLGTLRLDMWYDKLRLATVRLEEFSIEPGHNVYDRTCTGTFWNPIINNPEDDDDYVDDSEDDEDDDDKKMPSGFDAQGIARRFLSRYLDNFVSDVTLTGSILLPNGSSIPGTSVPLLSKAFQDFRTSLPVPGNPVPFIRGLSVSASQVTITKFFKDGGGIVEAMATLYNPFATDITITRMNLTVLAGNFSAPLGGWLVPEYGVQPIYIPARTEVVTMPLPVYLLCTDAVMACLLALIFGPKHETFVSVLGDIDTYIGTKAPGTPDPRAVFNQTLFAQVEAIRTTLGNITVTPPHQDDEELETEDQDQSGDSELEHHPLFSHPADPIESAARLELLSFLSQSPKTRSLLAPDILEELQEYHGQLQSDHDVDSQLATNHESDTDAEAESGPQPSPSSSSTKSHQHQ